MAQAMTPAVVPANRKRAAMAAHAREPVASAVVVIELDEDDDPPIAGNNACSSACSSSSVCRTECGHGASNDACGSVSGVCDSAAVQDKAKVTSASRSVHSAAGIADASSGCITSSPSMLPSEPPPRSAPQPLASPMGASLGASAASLDRGSAPGSARKRRPPVPAFGTWGKPTVCAAAQAREAWQLLRQMPLMTPKRAEDNYEISDKEDSDDGGELGEPDRSQKQEPAWCAGYLEALAAQSDVDPDTIFGCRLPRCDLEAIFTDSLYARCSRERPKRKRGSSGEWKKDRLKQDEIRMYKKKMGHTTSWTTRQ